MALLLVDGFDFWTTLPGFWTSAGANSPPTVTGGVLLINAGSGSSYVRWVFPATKQTVIFNTRANFGTKVIDDIIFQLYDGDTVQCTVTINGAGQLGVKRGSHTGTLIGSYSTRGLVQDEVTYYDIECKLTVANAGACIIQVNGEEVLNVTGDLASTANEYADNIVVGKLTNNAPQNGANNRFQHIILMDNSGSMMNDFIGPVKINSHALTADGNYIDYTANTGDRWDAVNDTNPDEATTYITSSTVGHKFTGITDGLGANVGTVHGLGVWVRSARDADKVRAYKTLLRYAGADQLGSSDKYIGPNYASQITAFDVSPFSATEWTTIEIDGLEVGVELTV